MKPRLVLGSRGSALAMAQVRLVQDALLRTHPDLEIEVKIITTSGDRRQDVRAGEGSAAGLKGLFTKEIQEALLGGVIDAAIHSLKDLPGIVPRELVIAAVLPRADTSDLLISPHYSSLVGLPAAARIGTGSVRRSRQLQWLRPGLEIIDLRGNVPTRLEKMVTQGFDGIVLARAGIERLGYKLSGGILRCESGEFHAAPLDILPAIGQGAIGIEIRREDLPSCRIISAINDVPAHTCIRVERELLRLLDGDCKLPVAARAALQDSSTLRASAIVFPDATASPPAQAQANGPASDPEGLALILFQQLRFL